MRQVIFLLSSIGIIQAREPRIWLDSTTLASMRQRALQETPEWVALRQQCNIYANATGNVWPQRSLDERYDWSHTGAPRTVSNTGLIAQGYQGSAPTPKSTSYSDAAVILGACYQATKVDQPALAATYRAKLSELADVLAVIPADLVYSLPNTVTSSSRANPVVFTSTAHGMAAGTEVIISGATGSWAATNGRWSISVTSSSTFTIPVSAAGFSGSFDGTVKIVVEVSDSTWALGTAWKDSGATVAGNQNNSGTITLAGLNPGGTLLAGDSFNVNGAYSFIVKIPTTADGSGNATVVVGTDTSNQVSGTIPNSPYPSGGLTDGWPITHEIVLAANIHRVVTGTTITVSGVVGNTNANGTFVAKALDSGWQILLQGSSRGTAVQTNLVWDAATNSGYGARFFGPALAQLYDWFYDDLTPDQALGLRTAIRRWIAVERRLGGSFGLSHPAGNFFAGFMVAWVMGALAIELEDPYGATLYDEFRQTYYDVPRGISDYFSNYMEDTMHPDGGGDYGQGAAMNTISVINAMETARGYDPINDPHPFKWIPGLAKWLIGNTRPSLTGYNPRSINVTTGNDFGPSTDYVRASLSLSSMVNHWLYKHGDPMAPYFKSYMNDITPKLKALTTGANPNYLRVKASEFIEYNDGGVTDYKTMPTSYYSQRAGELTWRSDWTSSAVMASFLGGPYLDSIESVKDSKDRGNLWITKGDRPLLSDIYWEYARYAAYLLNNYANLKGYALPQLQNILQVDYSVGGTPGKSRLSQQAFGPGFGVYFSTFDPTGCRKNNPSTISRRDVTAGYVYARAENLAYNYPTTTDLGCEVNNARVVKSWTREVFTLGNRTFLVHDISSVDPVVTDHFLAWHFPRVPSTVPGPAGTTRFDVEDIQSFADGPGFKGSVFTLLPAGRVESMGDVFPQYRYAGQPIGYRLEVRPPAGARDNDWLTMFDVSPSAAETIVPDVLPATNADAVQLEKLLSVAVFAKSEQPILPMEYVYRSAVPANRTHYVLGLAASTSYKVDRTKPGRVIISTGDGGANDVSTNASGVLKFYTTPEQADLPATLRISLSTVTFSCPSGGPSPADQSVFFTALERPVPFTATTASNWVGVRPASGTTPSDLTVSVDCSNLNPGTVSAAINLASTDPGVVNGPLTLNVVVEVGPALPNVLTLSASQLEFQYTLGSTLAGSKQVTASTSKAGTVFSVSGQPPWLLPVAFSAGSADIGLSETATALLPGVYNTSLTVSCQPACTAGSANIGVSLTVLPASTGRISRVLTTPWRSAVLYNAPSGAPCRVQASATSDFSINFLDRMDSGSSRQRVMVLGDDNALLPEATYYFRALCGYEESRTHYQTSAVRAAGASSIDITSAPPPSLHAARLRVEYGLETQQLDQAAESPCSSRCQVPLTGTHQSLLFVRRKWLDQSGKVVAASTVYPLVMP